MEFHTLRFGNTAIITCNLIIEIEIKIEFI